MPDESTRSSRWLLLRGGAAIVAAVGANAAVLRAGTRAVRLPPMYRPGALGPVLVPAAAAMLATAVYARLDGSDRRYPAFRRLLGLGLLVSFVPILVAAAVLDVSSAGVVVLSAQHVAVAAVIAGAFRPWSGAP